MKQRIVGIASLPERVDCLKDTINSLLPQCDKIILALNNYSEIPDFAKHEKIESYLLDNTLGDAAKFYKVEEYQNVYYFSADDDLIYPPNYVEYMINKTNKYNVPVGLHGVILHNPIKSLYRDRKVFHCLHDVNDDYLVDYIGTGVSCYDTSKLKVSINDFKHKNMADIWFGDVMNRNNIKPFVLEHRGGYLTYNQKMVDNKIDTIFDEYVRTKNDKVQTEIVNSWYKNH
jgi:hypothetical protein